MCAKVLPVDVKLVRRIMPETPLPTYVTPQLAISTPYRGASHNLADEADSASKCVDTTGGNELPNTNVYRGSSNESPNTNVYRGSSLAFAALIIGVYQDPDKPK
jgi:hypothetical protein